MSLDHPRVSIGIVGLTRSQRAMTSVAAPLVAHLCLLPYWFAVGFVWAGTPRGVGLTIARIYAVTAIIGWPVVAMSLVIWWWQGRGFLVRRVFLAAATLLFPIAVLLLFDARIRNAVVPPKLSAE